MQQHAYRFINSLENHAAFTSIGRASTFTCMIVLKQCCISSLQEKKLHSINETDKIQTIQSLSCLHTVINKRGALILEATSANIPLKKKV